MNQTIGVNITPQSFQPTLHYSQGDVGRVFVVNVTDYDIPTGATVTCVATKPSGMGFTVSGTVSGNSVTFTSTAEMTDEWGRFPAEIRIASGSILLGTANFLMIGEKDPHPASTIDGTQEELIPQLTLLVNRVEAAAESVHDLTVSATTLTAGSDATATYDSTNNSITFGIPRGADGDVTRSEFNDLKSDINDVNNCLELEQGINKWNPGEQSGNKIVSNQVGSLGELTDQNGYTTSGFIDAVKDNIIRWDYSNSIVTEGDGLTRSGNAYRIAEYDESKTGLLVTASWVSLPYTVQNASTKYIRVSVTSKPINSIIIGDSSTADITYSPYKIEAQRLVDIENEIEEIQTEALQYRTHSRNWLDPSTATPTTQGAQEIYYTDYIPVSEGEVLYASKSFSSYSDDTMTVDSFYFINCFDLNKNNVGNSGYWKTSYTIPSGVAYVRCYVGYTDYAKEMIEKDTQTLEWEPYWDSGYISNDPIARDGISKYDGSFLYGSVNMFDRIGAIGDSYTAGYAKASDGTYNTNKDHSYLGVMAKRAGINYEVYAQSGATTRSYITDKLPAVLADATCDFYFLALGINDVGLGTSYIGTIADIDDEDYTQNADTFYGNYGRIIAQVQEHAPKALFCLIKVPLCGTNVKAFDAAISEIGSHYGIPVIDPYDDDFFKTAVYEDMNDGHPTLRGYTGMALAYERLLSKAIYDNYSYFKFATIG